MYFAGVFKMKGTRGDILIGEVAMPSEEFVALVAKGLEIGNILNAGRGLRLERLHDALEEQVSSSVAVATATSSSTTFIMHLLDIDMDALQRSNLDMLIVKDLSPAELAQHVDAFLLSHPSHGLEL